MLETRTRILRSGNARSRPRLQYQVGLLAIIALVISACSTPGTSTARVQGQMIAIEAEDAVVEDSVFTVRDEPAASGGKVVVSTSNVTPAAEGAEDLALRFEVGAPGDYVLWARLKGSANDQSAMFLGFNGDVERVDLFHYGDYVWVAATIGALQAGEHFASIGHAEPETSLDALVISSRRDLTATNLERFLIFGEMPPGTTPGEQPTGDPDQQPETPAGDPGAPKPGTGSFGLLGDPNFDPANLSADAQVWHRRVWYAIEKSRSEMYATARSDDLYMYARELHTYVQSLLHAFRVTGDLRILDEVDTIAELMRDQLHDSWRDVRQGSSSEGKDGFRNWVWRGFDGDSLYGKDTHKMDDMKTHALVASVAYALDVNRGLKSPGGADYGSHADFWVEYLVDDFEAKWRERENEPKGFPIFIRQIAHAYYSWMKWHYYMAQLTGDGAYLKEAERMARMLEGETRLVDASGGQALVWAHSVMAEGGSEGYLEPTTYARYIVPDAVEMYFEGFAWWDEDALDAMARTVAQWVIDPKNATGSRDWFSGDIGRGRDRGGIESKGSWARMSYYKYERSSYAVVAPWDSTGLIDDMTVEVLDKVGDASKPRYPTLPVGMLVSAVMGGD